MSRADDSAVSLPNALYCYWVEEGRLLAGEYPGHPSDDGRVREKVGALLAAGVTLFVDLTHIRDGMRPYEPVLRELSPLTARLSAPIVDNDVPRSAGEMSRILDAIDAEIARGGIPYIHCWGGVGRTGTTVGCWFARHGREGDAALKTLRARWNTNPKSDHRDTPQTAAQRNYIRTWREDGNRQPNP